MPGKHADPIPEEYAIDSGTDKWIGVSEAEGEAYDDRIAILDTRAIYGRSRHVAF